MTTCLVISSLVISRPRRRRSAVPFVYQYINVLGSYSFAAVDQPQHLLVLRDPDAADEDT